MKAAGARHRTLVVLASCCALLAGCSRQASSPPYQTLSGVVRAIDPETGELLVRTERMHEPWPDGNVPCVTTKDSELYVNDRFSELRDVQVGDAVEAIGYCDPDGDRDRNGHRDQTRTRDRNVNRDRFVISLVLITRSEPQPPQPKFALIVSTQSSSEKHED